MVTYIGCYVTATQQVKGIAGFARLCIISPLYRIAYSILLEEKVVRLLLLSMFVVLPFESSSSPSWRQVSGFSKRAVRNGLHKLSRAHRTYLKRWLKPAVYGSVMAILALSTYSSHAEEGNNIAALNPNYTTPEAMLNEEIHTASWSITLTTKGEIAHMHVQTIEEEEAIRVAGYFKPTPRGQGYLEEEPILHYRVDKSYVLHNRAYNGITLPLRVSWLAKERSRVLGEIYATLLKVAANEKALVKLGNSMYRDFSLLDVATSREFGFRNLAQQTEVKFAGRRFIDYHAVREAIERRHVMLRSGKIAHKQRQRGVQLDQEVLNQAETAYLDALALLPPPSSEPVDLRLNLSLTAREDKDFVALVKSLAHLKLVRLRFATAILSFYEPFEIPFFYSAGGIYEHLKLYVYADDSQRGDVVLRYLSRTTSRRQRNLFTLGEVDFDHDLNIKKMWLSLKPRGGLASLAKLTFTPCTEGTCPEPDFGD